VVPVDGSAGEAASSADMPDSSEDSGERQR
jgi:hypothetical protein